jgi:hypothetical protein
VKHKKKKNLNKNEIKIEAQIVFTTRNFRRLASAPTRAVHAAETR